MKRNKSIYSVTFDKKNPYWKGSRDENIYFLRLQEHYLNHVLQHRERPGIGKYLYLNEVLEMLGFPKTEAGDYVGWIYSEENTIGDNFISFDLNPRGFNPNVVIDFNVDGNIRYVLRYRNSKKDLSN